MPPQKLRPAHKPTPQVGMEAQHAYEKSTQTFMSRAATRGSQSKAIRQVFLAHPYAMISLQTSNKNLPFSLLVH